MAGRSDFFSAALPRSIKRMLALQTFTNSHEEGAVRRLWIDAQAHAKRCKIRQNSSSFGRAATVDDVPETAE